MSSFRRCLWIALALVASYPSGAWAQDAPPAPETLDDAPPPAPYVSEDPTGGPVLVVPQTEPLAPVPPPPETSLAPVPPPPSQESPSSPLSDVHIEWTDADDRELERRSRIARIGGGLLPALTLPIYMGSIAWYLKREYCLEAGAPDDPCLRGAGFGIGIMAAGHAAGMMLAASSFRAARVLQDRGIAVKRGFGLAAIILAALPLGNSISWVFAWLQLSRNRRALMRARPSAPSVRPPPPPTWD